MLNWKNWQNMAVFDTKYEVSSYNIVIGATNNTHISLPILSDLSQPDIHPPWNISSLPSPTNYLSTYFITVQYLKSRENIPQNNCYSAVSRINNKTIKID